MSSNPNAEATAPSSRASDQGSGPLTSPEQSINRNPVEEGNTQAAESLNRSLTFSQKVDLVRQAMNAKHRRNFREWGHQEMAELLNYQDLGSMSLPAAKVFFNDLLFFLAKPKIAKAFDREVGRGLEHIRKLIQFFQDLEGRTGYDEWCDYCSLSDWKIDDPDFMEVAEKYLTPEELALVLAEEEDPALAKRRAEFIARQDVWLEKQRQEREATAARRPDIFKSDEEMIEALDRFYPGVKWPVDKKVVIYDQNVKFDLQHREMERLQQESETPEQKQARDQRAAIRAAMTPGIPFPKPLPFSLVKTATTSRANKPGRAVKLAAGAVAPKKAIKAARKPASKQTSKKKA